MSKYESLDSLVKELYGSNVCIGSKSPLAGGDINSAYKLILNNGETLFLKYSSSSREDMFLTESTGLKALISTGAMGVPAPVRAGTLQLENISFLMMEYIKMGGRGASYWEDFGHALARMHLSDTSIFVPGYNSGKRYGFTEDNYIGTTPQKNNPSATWAVFYRDSRLVPQMHLADNYLKGALKKKLLHIMDHIEDYIDEPARPSLIHGDLWGGNAASGEDGRPYIYDPAAYVGHHEAELAMTQLFGSFPQRFYDAYNEVYPIDSGYSRRRDVYNLYHLMNHLNLFGSGYLSSVAGIIASL